MKAEVISIGTELLLGEITDLNAAYLASQLPLLGLDLHFISTAGDNKQRLIETLKHAWQRSDIIITTGGLGPTEDDITREAIADLFGETISIDQSLVSQFRELFKHFNMEMPDSNIKQASVIPSCEVIPNPRGTAPGWWVEKNEHVIIAMPGPPGEMQQMWTNVIVPKIQDKFCNSIISTSTIKTFGLSEAKLGEITRDFLLAHNPTVGIYAKPDGIHLRVAAKADSPIEANKLVEGTVNAIRKLVGDYIWGMDSDTLEGVVADLFITQKMNLSTMESETGGILANSITNFPDSLNFYKCGIVLSRNELGPEFGISDKVLSQYGRVSAEVAAEMASSVRGKYNTSIGVGLTGILENNDPAGKIGTIIIGIDDGKHVNTHKRIFPGTRMQIKQRAAIAALFELRIIMR
ncbi:MAG: CinA family nicotinamide mononucleotide deamidase-related protein [Dehalococcoidia bacterium]|nr:MAG: CinA family nicotinamide mononucleotide deamidase-related protein [Dehalococcoidia bacterium]